MLRGASLHTVLVQLALCLAAGGPAVLGCGFSPPGEYTTESCNDGIDNDGDGVHDCDVPACRALTVCGGVIEGDVTLEALDPLPMDRPPVTDPPMRPEDPPDEAPIGDEDAGTAPIPIEDPCLPVDCGPDEFCQDGECLAKKPGAPALLRMSVQVNSIRLGSARQSSGACLDANDTCFVPTCLDVTICDLCWCEPDLFVVLLVDGEEAGRTDVVQDVVRISTWDARSLEATYAPGQRLEVVAYDWDPPRTAVRLFSCPIPEELGGPPFSCTAEMSILPQPSEMSLLTRALPPP